MSLPGSVSLLARVPSPASSIYGNVDGPASATNNAIALFDGTTGKLIKNSAYIMAGAGGTITVTGNATLNQDVSTSGSPSFAGLTLTGALAAGSNSITGGAGSFTTLSASGNLTVGPTAAADTILYIQAPTGKNPILRWSVNSVDKWGLLGEYPSAGNLTVYDYGSSAARASFTTTGLAVTGTLTTTGGATFQTTSTALTNGAGASTGTLTNAPAAGNPTKWIGINDNGTTRYIPAW